MPKQELFFEAKSGSKRVEVIKTYDQLYARQAFEQMDESALQRLWNSLKPEDTYEPADLPELGAPNGDGEAFLWDEVLEQARENGSVLSFFVVNEIVDRQSQELFVSPDWPTAETFAKGRLASRQIDS